MNATTNTPAGHSTQLWKTRGSERADTNTIINVHTRTLIEKKSGTDTSQHNTEAQQAAKQHKHTSDE